MIIKRVKHNPPPPPPDTFTIEGLTQEDRQFLLSYFLGWARPESERARKWVADFIALLENIV